MKNSTHIGRTLSGRHDFRERGFTLVELVVVIVIIGLVAVVVFPRFMDLNKAHLTEDAARLQTLIRYLNEASETRKLYYKANFDMEKETVEVESSRDGREYAPLVDSVLRKIKLGRGVDLTAVEVAGQGKTNTGQVSVVFTPFGTTEPFTLSLGADDAASVTVTFNPYSGRVTVESREESL